MNKDLTVGKPSKVLREFCIPLFASVIFQQLYNIADSLVAGKFIGESALAAVGNSYEVTLIFIAFAFGCNIGCSVIVSRFFGAKQYDKMKTAVSTTMIAGGVLCAVLMALGWFLCELLLQVINTPLSILPDSMLYLRIYILGLPFVMFYNIATGIFSALGDSKTPFWFLATSSTVNIGADILFVTAFKMGVSGVAWATFICQGISCLLALFFVVLRLRKIKTEKKAKTFSWRILGQISAVAVPSILQQSFVSVGNIVLQGVINTFGEGVIAGYSAAVKLNNLVVTSLVTFGNGISNYTSQNIGAQKPDRIGSGCKAGLKMVWVTCIPLVFAYLVFGRFFIHLFLKNGMGTAMDTGLQFLWIVSPFYFIVSAKIIFDGVLRGASKMLGFMASTFIDLILRVVLAVILSNSFGSVGIWMAWPIGWIIAAIISFSFYKISCSNKIKPAV